MPSDDLHHNEPLKLRRDDELRCLWYRRALVAQPLLVRARLRASTNPGEPRVQHPQDPRQ